ncbi:proline-, glutamic acid- and leucine-rich protein 1 [Gryllus bimaculatus]|nr:proline-, glutamic acid- and leucine-rich protein 1 [Gryllus bimaculatus]
MADNSSQLEEPFYLLDPLLNIKVRNENFQLLLKAFNEQHALSCKSENKLKPLVSTVNARLNELEHRSSGIQLLKALLAQCSDNVFVENSVSWMTQCIRAATTQQSVDEACEVLCLLIEMSHCFQELTKSKSPAALQCLEAVLHFYPGPCKVKVKIVEKYLLMFLDEEDKSLVEYASRCICYLPLLLTSGNKDGNAWTNTLTELCATASSLMFELFENIHEATVPPALTELPVGGDLTNVKAVRDDLLIALVYRVLAVNCNMVSRGKTLEHVAVVHLREVAYKFLESWVTRAKAASCVELICEDLITMMLQDVYQKKESVTLQFQEKGKTSLEKQLPQVRQQLVNPKVNFGSCAAALRALSAIIESSGALLGTNLHMRLQEVVVTLLLEIKLCSGPKEMPAPYSVAGCRMQLFRLLLALTLHPHPRWPPPTQFSLALFSLGQNDSSLEVAGFCNLAVACIRQMVHPSQSSHQFPISVNEMRASVGLSNLEVVRGLNLTIQKGQTKIAIETDLGLKSSNTENSQQTLCPNRSLKKKPCKSFNEVSLNDFGSSPNTSIDTSKPPNKKSRISLNKESLNGIELSPKTSSDTYKPPKKKRQSHSEIDIDKRLSTVSDKTIKKSNHLQFTVEELVSSADKTTSSNRGQGWEVTNVMEVKEKPIEKKFDKSTKSLETSVGIKRAHDSPKDTDKITKIRKLNESPKKFGGLSNEAPCDTLPNSNTAANSESTSSIKSNVAVTDAHINIEPNITITDADINDEPNVTMNEAGANVETSITINIPAKKKSESCMVNEEKTLEEKILKPEENKGETEAEVVEVAQHESKKRECEDHSTKTKDRLSDQSPLKSSLDKSDCSSVKDKVEVKSPTTKPHTVSECKRKEVNSKSPDVSDCKSKEVNSKSPVSDCKSKEAISKSPSPVSDGKSKEAISKSPVSDGKCKEVISKSPISGGKSKEVISKSPVSDGKSKEVNSKSPVSDGKSKEVNSKSPVSDCKSKEVNSKSPISNSKSKEENSPKIAIPVIELLHSSDSETDQKKRASGANRRITRSLAKRTSTPHRNSEQRVSIEELPCSQDTFAINEISSLEEESSSAGVDPSIELAESDESVVMNLCIESDRESVDIVDITNNKIDDEASAIKEKNETEISVIKTCPLSNPNTPGSKNLKDSVTSDREIEEVTEEMEAVMDSPDVTVDDVSACSDKENTAKKSTKETEEDGSGSETNEEEILASFVDALQPNSE